MKKLFSLVIVLVMVLAMTFTASAAGIDVNELLASMGIDLNLEVTDKPVTMSLEGAVLGERYFLDGGENYAVQVPSYMVEPEAMIADDMIIIADLPSVSTVTVMRLSAEIMGEDYADFIENFEEYMTVTRDVVAAMFSDQNEVIDMMNDAVNEMLENEELRDMLTDEEIDMLTDVYSDADYTFGGMEIVELPGVDKAGRFQMTVTLADETVPCYLYITVQNGDIYVWAMTYVHLTDAELEETLALPSKLISYSTNTATTTVTTDAAEATPAPAVTEPAPQPAISEPAPVAAGTVLQGKWAISSVSMMGYDIPVAELETTAAEMGIDPTIFTSMSFEFTTATHVTVSVMDLSAVGTYTVNGSTVTITADGDSIVMQVSGDRLAYSEPTTGATVYFSK